MELEIRKEFNKVFGNLLNNDRRYHGQLISFANSWIPVLFHVLKSSGEHPYCRFFIAKKYASPVLDQRKVKAKVFTETKNIELLEGNVEGDLSRILSTAARLNVNSYVFCLLPHSDNLLRHLIASAAPHPNIILMVDLDCLSSKGEEPFYSKIMLKYEKLKNTGWDFVQLNNYNLDMLTGTIRHIKANYTGQPSVIALKTNWMQMLIDL